MHARVFRDLCLSVLLAMCGSGTAIGQASTPVASVPWETQAATPPSPGIEPGRWQHIVEQLKARALTPEAANDCLAPAREAARLGLPVESVIARIEEGLVKGVDPSALQTATRLRLQHLQDSEVLLQQAGYANRCTMRDDLMKALALARESGLEQDTLQSVLANAAGEQTARMQSIIEAGEMMFLNGIDQPTTKQIMVDFFERNLRRMEIARACRFVVQQHGANVDAGRIRQQLWDGTGEGEQQRRGSAPGEGHAGPAARGEHSDVTSLPSGTHGSTGSPEGTPAEAGGEGGNGAANGGDHASSDTGSPSSQPHPATP